MHPAVPPCFVPNGLALELPASYLEAWGAPPSTLWQVAPGDASPEVDAMLRTFPDDAYRNVLARMDDGADHPLVRNDQVMLVQALLRLYLRTPLFYASFWENMWHMLHYLFALGHQLRNDRQEFQVFGLTVPTRAAGALLADLHTDPRLSRMVGLNLQHFYGLMLSHRGRQHVKLLSWPSHLPAWQPHANAVFPAQLNVLPVNVNTVLVAPLGPCRLALVGSPNALAATPDWVHWLQQHRQALQHAKTPVLTA